MLNPCLHKTSSAARLQMVVCSQHHRSRATKARIRRTRFSSCEGYTIEKTTLTARKGYTSDINSSNSHASQSRRSDLQATMKLCYKATSARTSISYSGGRYAHVQVPNCKKRHNTGKSGFRTLPPVAGHSALARSSATRAN
jgi:hypothetical protein